MAPIPPTTASVLAQTTQLSPWLKWFFLIILSTFTVSSTALALTWALRKMRESISTLIERLQERNLVLPTSLDPWTPRPIVLPLPENFISTAPMLNKIPIVIGKSTTTAGIDLGQPLLVSIQSTTSLWLPTTSLDRVESVDTQSALDTLALDSSNDWDTGSNDCLLQTPPDENALALQAVSHYKDRTAADNNADSAIDFFDSLASSTAFLDYPYLTHSNDDISGDQPTNTIGSSPGFDPLFYSAGLSSSPDLSRLRLQSTSGSRNVAYDDDDALNLDRPFVQEADLEPRDTQAADARLGLQASSGDQCTLSALQIISEDASLVNLSGLGPGPINVNDRATMVRSSPRTPIRRRLPPDKYFSPPTGCEESPSNLLRLWLLPTSDNCDATVRNTLSQTIMPYEPP